MLKRDISVLFDESLAFCGEIKDTSKRVYPFVCFINPKILHEKNVNYFDENYTFELRKTNFKGDTGCVLYMNRDKLPHKNIKFNDFVAHYGGGSYSIEVFNKIHRGQIGKERWLETHKSLWDDSKQSMPAQSSTSKDIKSASNKSIKLTRPKISRLIQRRKIR